MASARRLMLSGFLLLAGMLALASGKAASLQISPVGLRFAPAQQAASITLQNMGEAPIYGQVRVFRWEQQDGADVLLPTRELVASPPIVQIGAHASQAVRLVLTAANGSAPARAGEASYRILIDELGREDGSAAQGVDIRLRYSVPVFVGAPASPGQAAPSLDWQVFRQDGAWMLKVRNDGALHAQLGTVDFVNGAGARFAISQGLLGYVLAGRERLWRLPVAADADLAGVLAVKAVVNARAPAQFATRAP